MLYNPVQYGNGRFSVGRFRPERFSHERFRPGRFSSGRFSPGRFSPGRFSPGRFSSGLFSPGRFSSGRFDPGLFKHLDSEKERSSRQSGMLNLPVNFFSNYISMSWHAELLISQIHFCEIYTVG